MPEDPPIQPANLSTAIAETLEAYTADQVRAVARYADALTEHKDRTAQKESDVDEPKSDTVLDDRPDDVPAEATLTVKEIHDNRYYYRQWREGDSVTSKYKGPVDADE
jgi:hypothetical protein